MTFVRMWEARCVEGRTDEVAAWVREHAGPDAFGSGAHSVEVLRADHRVVLISRWPDRPTWVEPVPDPALVARCDAWLFES